MGRITQVFLGGSLARHIQGSSRVLIAILLAIGATSVWSFAHSAALQKYNVEQRNRINAADGKELSTGDVDRFVEDQMAALEIPGLSIAIINDGRIVYHRALGVVNVDSGEAVDEDSIFEAASLSKPVFAYFVMRMVENGVLDLDTPLHEYLPFAELEHDRRYQHVTARMVLNHTTGFPNWRWFDPAPPERNVPRGEMYLKHEPGTFSYSGEAYHYLARVIAHLTGTNMTTLDELIAREVSEPVGMQHAYWTWDDFLAEHKVMGHKEGRPAGREWPRSFPDDDPTEIGVAGRLHSEARSYARFLISLMDGEGLSEESLDEMLSRQSRVPEDHDTYLHTGDTAWGLGVGMEPTEYGVRYEHGGNNGGFQSGFMFYKVQRLGYVFMTNSDRGAELNDRLEVFLTEGAWSLAPARAQDNGSVTRLPFWHPATSAFFYCTTDRTPTVASGCFFVVARSDQDWRGAG